MATGTDFMKVDIKMAIKAAGRFDSTMPTCPVLSRTNSRLSYVNSDGTIFEIVCKIKNNLLTEKFFERGAEVDFIQNVGLLTGE